MYYAKSTNGFYIREIHGDNIPSDAVEITQEQHSALLQGQYEGKLITADENGYPILVDQPPTAEQITAALTASIQSHMDSQARALNYDDIKAAITYADEPAVPRFQAEGLAFREWRSLCWAHCYAAMNAMNLGERAIPTAEELIAELPALVLPE